MLARPQRLETPQSLILETCFLGKTGPLTGWQNEHCLCSGPSPCFSFLFSFLSIPSFFLSLMHFLVFVMPRCAVPGTRVCSRTLDPAGEQPSTLFVPKQRVVESSFRFVDHLLFLNSFDSFRRRLTRALAAILPAISCKSQAV